MGTVKSFQYIFQMPITLFSFPDKGWTVVWWAFRMMWNQVDFCKAQPACRTLLQCSSLLPCYFPAMVLHL